MSGVVGASPKTEEGNIVEIVNSDFSPSNCKEDKLEFPPRRKAFGGQIGEINIICGGKYDQETIYGDCISISKSGEVNKSFSRLQIPRYGAASVIWNNTLYISGGSIPKEDQGEIIGSIKAINSTEVIGQNNQENIKKPTNLTQPLSGHCAILLSTEKIIMIIGGADLKNGDQKKTYFVDPKENFNSSDGPSMTYERSFHACGSTVFENEDYVMVVGGFPRGSKVELYQGSNGNWTECKLLTFHFLQ